MGDHSSRAMYLEKLYIVLLIKYEPFQRTYDLMPDELSVRCGGKFQLEQFFLFIYIVYRSLLGNVSFSAMVLLLKQI